MTALDISNGVGIVSEVLRCTVHFVDSSSESDTYTTILKIPGMESMTAINESGGTKFPLHEEKFINKLIECHQTEVDFYEHICKYIDMPAPRVFKTLPWEIGQREGVIHMEDMVGKGKPCSINETLTIPQIKEVVKHLVHMHRKVLTLEDKEFDYWKSQHNKNQHNFMSMCHFFNDPEPFLEICGNKGELLFRFLIRILFIFRLL